MFAYAYYVYSVAMLNYMLQLRSVSCFRTQICYFTFSYCRAEMYAGRVACCPLMSHGECADGQTDRRTDARPLHYACH